MGKYCLSSTRCYHSGMPPSTGQPAFVPPPSPAAAPQPRSYGAVVVALFVFAALIVGAYAWWSWDQWMPQGEVATILVRDAETGGRSMIAVDLEDGSVREAEATIFTVPESFTLSDETEIALNSSGIVNRVPGSESQWIPLITSPVSPPPGTPFAVWGDGARLAWVNPADSSIQAYERLEDGSYGLLMLSNEKGASSLAFAKGGTVLVLGSIVDMQTHISVLDIVSGISMPLATVPGFASVIQIP